MRKRHLNKNVTRRDILRFTMAGAGLAALGPLNNAFVRPATGAPIAGLKRLVVLYAYGGYDGLNLLVPVTNNAYYTRRTNESMQTIAIDPGNALALNGTADYALHPNFDHLQSLYNDVSGDAAAFRMVGYPGHQNLSHFISQDIYSWGVRDGFGGLAADESGWIARTVNDMNLSATGAVAVAVGRPLDVEGADQNPLLVSSLNAFRITPAAGQGANHDLRMDTISRVLSNFSGSTVESEAASALNQGIQLADQVQDAVDNYSSTVEYPFDFDRNGNRYDTTPGRYLRDVAKLIQGGFDTQVFFTGIGGWDTHANQGNETGNQANLITRVDDALAAFTQDLKDMGVWDDTLILFTSEFGRRNFINAGLGTDHGHGNMFFAAGGSVNGGLYGPEVTESDVADSSWLGYGLDFRDIYREAVTYLGADGNAVFPEPQTINTTLNYV